MAIDKSPGPLAVTYCLNGGSLNFHDRLKNRRFLRKISEYPCCESKETNVDADQKRIDQLAKVLALPPDTLGRHIMRPLAPPMARLLRGWQVPVICQKIFAITDGFLLFGKESWNAFKFWGSKDYEISVELIQQLVAEKLFPIFGEIPHMVSISSTNGVVLATDWEVYRRPEHGWGKVIAPTLEEYIQTVVHVREAYGDNEDQPTDWWHPYASHGTRFDLEQ
ncbi:MAG: hypothetical protein ACO1RA_06285 [Planctomycetaceae bacterium]